MNVECTKDGNTTNIAIDHCLINVEWDCADLSSNISVSGCDCETSVD